MTDDNKTTPTAAPALDLDAVECETSLATREAMLAAHRRVPSLIVEVRALRAEVARLDAKLAEATSLLRSAGDLFVEMAERDAEIARLTAELAAARAEVDCGQDGPCAKAPGCARHWQERNRELVAELAAARAVTAGVCRYLDCAASNLLAVVTSLYESRARAISDATDARGTVGGLPPEVFAGVSVQDLRERIKAIRDSGERPAQMPSRPEIALRAVLARLDATLVAPVDPEAFVRQFADIAANAASPSRPPRWDEYTDEHRAVRVSAMRAALIARGIPVTPEAGK